MQGLLGRRQIHHSSGRKQGYVDQYTVTEPLGKGRKERRTRKEEWQKDCCHKAEFLHRWAAGCVSLPSVLTARTTQLSFPTLKARHDVYSGRFRAVDPELAVAKISLLSTHSRNSTSACVLSPSILRHITMKSEQEVKRVAPGWCSSVDWAWACKPKGCWFDSQLGHMPGLQTRSPVGDTWGATTHWCFSPSPSPSLPLSLNK